MATPKMFCAVVIDAKRRPAGRLGRKVYLPIYKRISKNVSQSTEVSAERIRIFTESRKRIYDALLEERKLPEASRKDLQLHHSSLENAYKIFKAYDPDKLEEENRLRDISIPRLTVSELPEKIQELFRKRADYTNYNEFFKILNSEVRCFEILNCLKNSCSTLHVVKKKKIKKSF